MRNFLRRLLAWLGNIIYKLAQLPSQKSRRKSLYLKKKPPKPKFDNSRPEKQAFKSSYSSIKTESRNEYNFPGSSTSEKADMPQESLRSPSLPQKEFLIDKPLEFKYEEESIKPSSTQNYEGSNSAYSTAKTSPPSEKYRHTDKSSQKRPYLKYRTDELEKIVDLKWNSLKILNEIYEELQYRSRKKARALSTRISKRLKELRDKEGFVWPTTSATQKPGFQSLSNSVFRQEEGILRRCGYRVGVNGLSESQRRRTLDDVFLHTLPAVEDISYLSEWGQPGTEKRLQKLAESIAAFTRNAKRRNTGTFDRAIRDWETDLAYLKNTYYDKRFNFRWPRTSSSKS